MTLDINLYFCCILFTQSKAFTLGEKGKFFYVLFTITYRKNYYATIKSILESTGDDFIFRLSRL